MSHPTSYRLWLKPRLNSRTTSLKNGSGRPGRTEHGMSDLNSATRDADASAVRSGPCSGPSFFAASTPASIASNFALVAEEVLEVAVGHPAQGKPTSP